MNIERERKKSINRTFYQSEEPKYQTIKKMNQIQNQLKEINVRDFSNREEKRSIRSSSFKRMVRPSVLPEKNQTPF